MTKSLPTVAIVILNWNGRHFLEQFLPSVLATNYTNTIIYVADNGSTDDSIDFVQKNFPSIQIIDNQHNYGFAEGYNQALKHVIADYYVLLNSDVEVTPNWVSPIIDYMEQEAGIGACQPKVRAFHRRTYFEYAGAAGGWMDSLGYMFCRGRIVDECEEDTGQYDEKQEIFWATGAALFVRAQLYHELGGLDADFFAHMEEIDLCWRIQRAGYSIWCVPNSVVYHVGGGTLQKANPRKTYLNFRNNLALLFKNLPITQLFFVLPLRFCLDAIALLRFLFQRQKSDAWAIHKAHLHFLSKLFFWHKKRKISYQQVTETKIEGNKNEKLAGLYRGSIIFDYFVRGKRRFSEIITNKK